MRKRNKLGKRVHKDEICAFSIAQWRQKKVVARKLGKIYVFQEHHSLNQSIYVAPLYRGTRYSALFNDWNATLFLLHASVFCQCYWINVRIIPSFSYQLCKNHTSDTKTKCALNGDWTFRWQVISPRRRFANKTSRWKLARRMHLWTLLWSCHLVSESSY